MLVIALVIVLLLASGGAIVGSLVMTQRSRRELEQRVNQMVGGATASGQRRTPQGTNPAWITAIEERLCRLFALGLAHQWGAQIPPFQLILVGVLAGSTIWSVTRVAVQLPFWLALPLTFGGFLLAPRILLVIKQSRTEKKFIALFPDALDLCVRMLRAGLPVSAAIRTIGVEGPPPINQVFAVIADRVEIGIPLEEALRITGKELGLDEFRFFAAVVALQRSTGGNLAQTLEMLADIMRKRRAMRLKARATTSEVRASAYILGSMPFMIIIALLVLSPDYLAPLFSDPRGHIVLGSATGSLALAFYTMHKLVRSVTAT
ncbi:MAG: type II secretion system F family protein [Stellaceae bacterium]